MNNLTFVPKTSNTKYKKVRESCKLRMKGESPMKYVLSYLFIFSKKRCLKRLQRMKWKKIACNGFMIEINWMK